eukprot:174636_1
MGNSISSESESDSERFPTKCITYYWPDSQEHFQVHYMHSVLKRIETKCNIRMIVAPGSDRYTPIENTNCHSSPNDRLDDDGLDDGSQVFIAVIDMDFFPKSKFTFFRSVLLTSGYLNKNCELPMPSVIEELIVKFVYPETLLDIQQQLWQFVWGCADEKEKQENKLIVLLLCQNSVDPIERKCFEDSNSKCFELNGRIRNQKQLDEAVQYIKTCINYCKFSDFAKQCANTKNQDTN